MSEKQYDLAVSFAGEQRDYVARTVAACKALGLKVFYDKDKNNDWWGSNFIREQRAVYGSQTQYFVPFISAEYLAKPVPMDEFSSAMMTAVKQGDGYVLPVLMGDVSVPADLLHPHIHYLNASDFTPDELAKEFERKVSHSKQEGRAPTQLGPAVEHALSVRLPKVVPTDWSKYEELERIFTYLGDSFASASTQLRPQGYVCTVNRTHDRIAVRVERSGETVFSLDVMKGGQMGDDKITWSLGRHRSLSNGFNGWASSKFDKERGVAVVEVSDFGSHVGGNSDLERGVSKEDFFSHLWGKIIDGIERR